jgi:hypothetical protein
VDIPKTIVASAVRALCRFSRSPDSGDASEQNVPEALFVCDVENFNFFSLELI